MSTVEARLIFLVVVVSVYCHQRKMGSLFVFIFTKDGGSVSWMYQDDKLLGPSIILAFNLVWDQVQVAV